MPRNPDFIYTFVKVTLDNITNGQDFYEVRNPDKHRYTGTYTIGDDYWYDGGCHKQFITQETKELFLNAKNEFNQKVERAINGLDDYTVIKVATYQLAYKKLLQELSYSFVIAGVNYTKIFTVKDILYFLDRYLILPTCSRKQEESDLLELYSKLYTAAIENNDLYLAYVLKEYNGTLTQDEADYLYNIDKTIRFVPDEKIYDINDIEIIEVKKGRNSFSNRAVNFICNVIIKGKEFLAIWYPSDKKFETKGYFFTRALGNSNLLEVDTISPTNKLSIRHTITISDSVKQIIEHKTKL